MSNNSKLSILTNGILNENPVLRLVLGTCPTLAVTTMASNGIGMGLAATFVLLCSNVAISALRKIIPDQVRIPCFITVIAGFVSLVQMLVKAYVPDLDTALGVYLPLITTNCTILGVTILNLDNGYSFPESIVCAAGAGIGFLVAMVLFSGVRRKVEQAIVPECFKGLPITLLAAAITSLSFMGFGGLVENLFNVTL